MGAREAAMKWIGRFPEREVLSFTEESVLGTGGHSTVTLGETEKGYSIRKNLRLAVFEGDPDLADILGEILGLNVVAAYANPDLNHPHLQIPYGHSMGSETLSLFYHTPRVDGMRVTLRESGLPNEELLQAYLIAAQTLGYYHHTGYVHRDFHHGNVFCIVKNGKLQLADGTPAVTIGDLDLSGMHRDSRDNPRRSALEALLLRNAREDPHLTRRLAGQGLISTRVYASDEVYAGKRMDEIDWVLEDIHTLGRSMASDFLDAELDQDHYITTVELRSSWKKKSMREVRKKLGNLHEVFYVIIKATDEAGNGYRTASEFAEDLQRVAEGKSVEKQTSRAWNVRTDNFVRLRKRRKLKPRQALLAAGLLALFPSIEFAKYRTTGAAAVNAGNFAVAEEKLLEQFKQDVLVYRQRLESENSFPAGRFEREEFTLTSFGGADWNTSEPWLTGMLRLYEKTGDTQFLKWYAEWGEKQRISINEPEYHDLDLYVGARYGHAFLANEFQPEFEKLLGKGEITQSQFEAIRYHRNLAHIFARIYLISFDEISGGFINMPRGRKELTINQERYLVPFLWNADKYGDMDAILSGNLEYCDHPGCRTLQEIYHGDKQVVGLQEAHRETYLTEQLTQEEFLRRIALSGAAVEKHLRAKGTDERERIEIYMRASVDTQGRTVNQGMRSGEPGGGVDSAPVVNTARLAISLYANALRLSLVRGTSLEAAIESVIERDASLWNRIKGAPPLYIYADGSPYKSAAPTDTTALGYALAASKFVKHLDRDALLEKYKGTIVWNPILIPNRFPTGIVKGGRMFTDQWTGNYLLGDLLLLQEI